MSSIADAAIQILVQASSMDTKVTALKLVDALLGKGPCKIQSWKNEKKLPKSQIEHIVALFLIGGQLREDFHFTPYNTISYILPGRTQIKSPFFISLPFSKEPSKKGTKRKKKEAEVVNLDSGSDFD